VPAGSRICLACLDFASGGPANRTEVGSSETRIDWTLGATLHEVEGTFRLKSGDIVFNPNTGEASGRLIVDATSGDSGNKKRDADMNKNFWRARNILRSFFS